MGAERQVRRLCMVQVRDDSVLTNREVEEMGRRSWIWNMFCRLSWEGLMNYMR